MRNETLPELPNTLAQCHALLKAQAETIEQLSARMDYLVRRLFGTRSERFDPNQLPLFGEAMKARVLQSNVIHTDDTPVQVQVPGKKRKSRTLSTLR